jgi:ABC-2 type transport system permease protein
LVPILLVSLIGLAAEHVHLSADRWLLAIVGIWLATIPFTALGLLIGQLATADSLQAYSMSFLLILSLLGGLWIPVTQFPSWLQNLAQMLPSYWLAEIGHSAVGLSVNVPHAIMNLAAWTVVFAFIGARRYQRDALRA